ncbi:MAG: hypothetical protein WC251_05660 [Candidatus Izemoplasmatales bacterium]|jgi:hypothetical protein
MKKITFNVYKLNLSRLLDWKATIPENEHPRYYPTEVYDIVPVEGWLLSNKDIEKIGCFYDTELLEKIDAKFVAHHAFRSFDGDMSDWWTVSEYSTSASMLPHAYKSRTEAIFKLGQVLTNHYFEIEPAIQEYRERRNVINGECLERKETHNAPNN